VESLLLSIGEWATFMKRKSSLVVGPEIGLPNDFMGGSVKYVLERR
jgi:hypothetical protein